MRPGAYHSAATAHDEPEAGPRPEAASKPASNHHQGGAGQSPLGAAAMDFWT